MLIKYISETYFKNPEQMKKEIEKNKSISPAEKLQKSASKMFLKNILQKINLKEVNTTILNAFTYSTEVYHLLCARRGSQLAKNYDPSKTNGPEFLLLSGYINSDYFELRLLNYENLVEKEDWSLNVALLYKGRVDIVYENANDIASYDNGRICMSYRTPYPNPEIDEIENDLEILKKFLEYKYPGVYFKISFNICDNMPGNAFLNPFNDEHRSQCVKLASVESDMISVLEDAQKKGLTFINK